MCVLLTLVVLTPICRREVVSAYTRHTDCSPADSSSTESKQHCRVGTTTKRTRKTWYTLPDPIRPYQNETLVDENKSRQLNDTAILLYVPFDIIKLKSSSQIAYIKYKR